jgi:hypothetical protein
MALMNNSSFSLVKLPDEIQLTLFLIKEELKSRKLFYLLEKIGVNESAYEPHLDKIILKNLDLDDGKDETFSMYFEIMEKRTRKVKGTNESLMKQAMKAYVELVAEKNKRK